MNFQVLTNEQINRIHAASIRILETVGVRIPHATVREKFRQAKAEVDESDEMVKIPEHLVMDSLGKAGKSFCV